MNYAFAESPSVRPFRPRDHSVLSPPLIGGMVALFEAVLSLLLAGGAYVFYLEGILNASQFPRYGAVSLFGTALIVVGNHFLGLYRPQALFGVREQAPRIILSVTIAAALILLFGFLLQITSEYSRGWAAIWFVGNQVVLLTFRSGLATWLTRQEVAGSLRREVVVIGTGPMGARLLRYLSTTAAHDVVVRGVFHESLHGSPEHGARELAGYPVLGPIDSLAPHIRERGACDVVLAVPMDEQRRFEDILRSLNMLPVDVYAPPGEILFEIACRQPNLTMEYIAGLPMLQLLHRPLKGWNAVLKRAEDLVLVSILLSFFGPLMLFVALGVALSSPGPVLFRQKRFGFNNRPFNVLKFRTMYVDQGDASGQRRTVRGDPRVTPFGAFLRKTSLDELPQLINVLRGEMSIVGPRAHPVAMMAGDKLYHEAVGDYIARHRVRPGITGLAQVSGSRGEIDSLEKGRRRVELDLRYIENFSIWLDLKILFRTAVCLIKDKNVY
jgi:Undecaprenyl-phosphate glucose phosphotransferase